MDFFGCTIFVHVWPKKNHENSDFNINKQFIIIDLYAWDIKISSSLMYLYKELQKLSKLLFFYVVNICIYVLPHKAKISEENYFLNVCQRFGFKIVRILKELTLK